MERGASSPFFFGRPLWTGNVLPKRPFSKTGSNVVDGAVILMEFLVAPHERRGGDRQAPARPPNQIQ
jgi:hypothetical protein